jgi:hypothetical protein
MPPRGFAVPRWLLIVVAMLGVAGLGVAGATGFSATQELTRQQSALSAVQSEQQVADTDLAASRASLGDAQAAHQQASARLTDLGKVFAGQKACMDARTADFRELDRISLSLNDLWNRTAENSDFAKATEARIKALDDARKDYNEAAYRRSLGQISTANSWLSKAHAAEQTAAAKKTFMDGVLAEVDQDVAKVKADLDALETRLDETASTCAKTG